MLIGSTRSRSGAGQRGGPTAICGGHGAAAASGPQVTSQEHAGQPGEARVLGGIAHRGGGTAAVTRQRAAAWQHLQSFCPDLAVIAERFGAAFAIGTWELRGCAGQPSFPASCGRRSEQVGGAGNRSTHVRQVSCLVVMGRGGAAAAAPPTPPPLLRLQASTFPCLLQPSTVATTCGGVLTSCDSF